RDAGGVRATSARSRRVRPAPAVRGAVRVPQRLERVGGGEPPGAGPAIRAGTPRIGPARGPPGSRERTRRVTRHDRRGAASSPGSSLLSFEDVLVSPYTALFEMGKGSHRGGPHWPDWDRQTVARHNNGGKVIDDPPEAVPSEPVEIAEPVAWAGP